MSVNNNNKSALTLEVIRKFRELDKLRIEKMEGKRRIKILKSYDECLSEDEEFIKRQLLSMERNGLSSIDIYAKILRMDIKHYFRFCRMSTVRNGLQTSD